MQEGRVIRHPNLKMRLKCDCPGPPPTYGGYRVIMKVMKLFGLAVLMALAGLIIAACSGDGGEDGASAASSRSENVFAVSGQARLIVDTFNGRIEITGSETREVRVEAEFSNPERVKYRAVQEGDTIRVTAEGTGGDSFWGWLPWRDGDAGADIRVGVPRETVLEGAAPTAGSSSAALKAAVPCIRPIRALRPARWTAHSDCPPATAKSP